MDVIALSPDHVIISDNLEGDASEEFNFTQAYTVSVLLVYCFTYLGAYKLISALPHLICVKNNITSWKNDPTWKEKYFEQFINPE